MKSRKQGAHLAPLTAIFWIGILGLPAFGAGPEAAPSTQDVLNQMHEVNERGLIQGQQSNLDVKNRQLEQRRMLDQSLDQTSRNAVLPRLESKETEIASQQKALSAKKKQLGIKIPKPPPITSVEP